VSDGATSDESGAVAGFADATGRFLPLVCTLNATKVTDAVRRLLGVNHAEFDALVTDGFEQPGGPVLLPYFDGERTPNRPKATGILAGLRSDVTREQLAAAAVDGVLCGMVDAVDALATAGVDITGTVHLVGGGANSAATRQRLADLIGRPVAVWLDAEHVALGACVQAAAVLTGRSPLDVRASWPLEPTMIVAPRGGVDADAVRAAYALIRDGAGG
jgi:xylulokinase